MSGTLGLERTPDGHKIVVAREVSASQERGWELLTDTERWPEWGPSVRAVDCDDQFIEPDSTGRVRVPGGLWVPFRITGCEPYRWTWRVAGIPATGHRVDPPAEGVPEERCRVVFELPVLAVGYVPVCIRALDRIESILS